MTPAHQLPGMFALELLFWISLAGVVYAYVVYPVLVWLFARTFGAEPSPPADIPDEQLPRVSVLIAAYNEETVIGPRIENALQTDYPAAKLEIVIASDGSSDGTNAIVRSYAGRGVRLLDFHQRQGKAGVLNAAFDTLDSDIVALSDANTHTDPAALRRLVRWFREPSVGAVCGRLILSDPAGGTNTDSVYWRYETFLKNCESRLGALLGANGAIYAIRRELYPGIRRNTLIDDFVIPLLMRLRTGRTITFDHDAVAYEETPDAISAEFTRRARIASGGFQSMPMLWGLLDPRQGWIAYCYFSHKIMRWFCPFFLIAAFVSNAALAGDAAYRILFVGQLLLYGAAAIGSRVTSPGIAAKCLRMAGLFAGMNLALLVGFWRWVTTEPAGAWSRTARQ